MFLNLTKGLKLNEKKLKPGFFEIIFFILRKNWDSVKFNFGLKFNKTSKFDPKFNETLKFGPQFNETLKSSPKFNETLKSSSKFNELKNILFIPKF